MNIPRLDQKTVHALGFGILASIILIAVVQILLLQRQWPVSTTETLGFSAANSLKNTPYQAPPTYSYEEALEAYDGRRIQIANCSATPTTMTLKNNTTIMLDGKSTDPQRITINGKYIILDGFDYSLVTLTSVKTPETLSLHCETTGREQFNIAQILLQQ